MSYLLDTNVVSEIRRRRPDPGVAAWWDGVPAGRLCVSALTIGELHRGVSLIAARGDTSQARHLSTWLSELVARFADRVLSVDAAVARVWGRFDQAQPIPAVDGLLAATASVHGLTLVTRNVRHIERTGVDVLDPFTGD